MRLSEYLIIVFLALFYGCNEQRSAETGERNEPQQDGLLTTNANTFGQAIDVEEMTEGKLEDILGDSDSLYVTVKGKVADVCQKKGCWMNLETAEKETMLVTFKDYGFFVPMDAAEKTAVIEGVLKREKIDVATLQHFAEDAGKSSEEIQAITQPEEKYTFEAVGVVLSNEATISD